ncbi:hypothetical protein D9M68_469720 [compost metagenome]
MHRSGAGEPVLPVGPIHHRCRTADRRRCHPPRLRLPFRERRLRPCLRGGRHHLHRPDRGSHPPDGQQAPVQAGHAGSRRALHPRLRRRRTGRRHPGARSPAHRLPLDDQGQCRRRRTRHAPGKQPGRTGRATAHRPFGGAERLRQRRTDPGKGSAAAAPCGNPGVRRSIGQPGLPGRARLLGAAPPPEGDRRSALPGDDARAAPGHGRGGGEGRAQRQLRRRRHGGIPAGRARRLLLPGNEYPPAGGAPGHRTGHRPGPGGLADHRCRGPAAAARPGRNQAAWSRHGSAPLRRGPGRRLPPPDRQRAALGAGGACGHPHRPRAGGRPGGDALLRPHAGQGHRLGRHPRRGQAQAGACGGGLRAVGRQR